MKFDRKYIAVMYEEKDGVSVVFPDFLGCVVTADNMKDAKKYAKEALEAHLEFMAKDGDLIPEESDLKKVSEWLTNCDGVPHLDWVGVKMPKSKAVRINITIDEYLLQKVDKKLHGHANKRSRFIAEALSHIL